MTDIHDFKLEKKQHINELKSDARLYIHKKTGAEVLSLSNEDENKVFGVAFRTPPSDSTGVAHILEHSVLCGSRKYPVKEPFVELLKGSLQTFLNAFTYPDKTCYPVASQNIQDFYNLIDVYLDAVFYPRINRFIFQQEGWHYDLEDRDDLLSYKGVVFNEMKGAYSSPDSLLAEYSLQSLFPDNSYGFDSGGDPKQIPNLTFEQFREFHKRYYHPSNARIYFYGDDDPDERLRLVNRYLDEFDPIEIDSMVRLQAPFKGPKGISHPFMVSKETAGEPKGMVTLNWMLAETCDAETNFSLRILEHILLGMPGSPLRKALIDSGLGEDVAGEGMGTELRQIYFSTGLKGIDIQNADRIESLILDTLGALASNGIDSYAVKAALNTIEFRLRENNTGAFPRGLSLMLRALTTWLYGGDPLALLAFEGPLERLKSRAESDNSLFEKMIDRLLISNPHRTTLVLKPDSGLAKREEETEKERLTTARSAMDLNGLEALAENTLELRRLQETPDPPEALATIPLLKLEALDKNNKTIPSISLEQAGIKTLYHDLFTNGIAYVDLGLDLHNLGAEDLSYVPLFGRALVEMGTETEDFVALTQRIGSKTGGIRPQSFTSDKRGSKGSAAWLFLRGKAMLNQVEYLINILRDVLLTVRLDNQDRFIQMVMEENARVEQRLIPGGHQIINLRLRAHFSEAGWASEQMNGISYLFFLRALAKKVHEDWPGVLATLEGIREKLLDRKTMIANITVDHEGWTRVEPCLNGFLSTLPEKKTTAPEWPSADQDLFEGMTIPSQVNYVGKGADIYGSGYLYHGSASVITRYLRNAWLWDRVRVKGGAYGAFCLFDRMSGVLTFVSYRDPNLLKTVETFDLSARFLENTTLNDKELAKSIIGAIGDLDTHMLPDTKGFTSMLRDLTGDTTAARQQMREEILGTGYSHFRKMVQVLEGVRKNGIVKVLSSTATMEETLIERPGWLKIINVL